MIYKKEMSAKNIETGVIQKVTVNGDIKTIETFDRAKLDFRIAQLDNELVEITFGMESLQTRKDLLLAEKAEIDTYLI